MSDPYNWTEHYINDGWSMGQIRSVIFVPKATALLSIAGSAYVIQDVLRDPRKRKESTFHRLMVGVCISDIIYSFFLWFLGSWVMPKGSQLYAIGNNVTCQISAAFSVAANVHGPLCTCSLATYYLVQLRYNWVDRKIKAAEKYLHIIPVVFGVVNSAIFLIEQKFGTNATVCG